MCMFEVYFFIFKQKKLDRFTDFYQLLSMWRSSSSTLSPSTIRSGAFPLLVKQTKQHLIYSAQYKDGLAATNINLSMNPSYVFHYLSIAIKKSIKARNIAIALQHRELVDGCLPVNDQLSSKEQTVGYRSGFSFKHASTDLDWAGRQESKMMLTLTNFVSQYWKRRRETSGEKWSHHISSKSAARVWVWAESKIYF